jgi:O-antigen/teichoic acid export membrane protein
MSAGARPSAMQERALVGNTLWNLAGTFLPLLVGLAAVPLLLHALGIERFGLLSLIWMLTGYFGLLDLGFGRALTKLVAEHVGQHVGHKALGDLPRLMWTALWLMSGFGAAGAVVLALAAEPVARGLLNIPVSLQAEAVGAIGFLALSIPVAIATTGLRGVMEGLHLFRLANLIRVPLAALTFLAPLAVAMVTPDLAMVSMSLLGVRLLGLAAHWMACLRALPALAQVRRPDRALFRLLLGFGGWLTVTNVVSPLMTYIDRFVIGALFDLAAVAYYTTPYELLTKLWLFPFALTAVLFPTFSSTLAQRSETSAPLMVRSIAAVFVVILPIVMLGVAFAREGLGLWLGDDFALHSFRVAQWLAAGVLVNSMAQIPFTFVQGAGRPDWIAKLHLLELPFYFLGLWWALDAAGIEGAAIAWTARVTVDAAALLWMAHVVAPSGIRFPPRLAFAVALACGALACIAVLESMLARGLIAFGATGALVMLLWGISFGAEPRKPGAARPGL